VTYFNDIIARVTIDGDATDHILQPGVKILEVCAGPGTYTQSMIRRVGVEQAMQYRILVSDFAEGMVDAAREAVTELIPGHPNLEFRVIDVQNVEVESASYDLVACIFGYFVPDRMKAFGEVCRVCRPGGKAIIATWKYAGYAVIFSDFLMYMGRPAPLETLPIAHSCADAEKLRDELLGLGFSKVEVQEHDKVFEVLQTDEVMDALMFGNPMFAKELAGKEPAEVKAKWFEYLLQDGLPYKVEQTPNGLVLHVQYTANVAIAIK
jgi:ubiquinone/menaquinone biosynthesis C-methylase UbiE